MREIIQILTKLIWSIHQLHELFSFSPSFSFLKFNFQWMHGFIVFSGANEACSRWIQRMWPDGTVCDVRYTSCFISFSISPRHIIANRLHRAHEAHQVPNSFNENQKIGGIIGRSKQLNEKRWKIDLNSDNNFCIHWHRFPITTIDIGPFNEKNSQQIHVVRN